MPDVRRVVDLFSGTSRVGHALKATGRFVRANDHTAYGHALARCYLQADAERVAGPAALEGQSDPARHSTSPSPLS